MFSLLHGKIKHPREPIFPVSLHSMDAPPSFLQRSYLESGRSRAKSPCDASPRPGFSESHLSQAVHPSLRRPPRRIVRGVLLLARLILSVPGAWASHLVPSLLCLDVLRA